MEKTNKFFINMMGFFAFLCFGVLAVDLVMSMAIAQEMMEVPTVNPFQKLAELLLNWKTLSPVAKGIGFVLVLTQLIKQATGFKYKRLLVAVLSIAYGVLMGLTGDLSVSAVLMTVMFSAGGSQILYEALKPFLREIPMFSFLNLSKDD